MRTRTLGSLILCGLATCLAGLASAATTLNGFQLYAVGDPGNVFASFDPSAPSNAGHRMYDDGATGGDATADDHVWSYAATGLTPAAANATVGWKMGGWDGVGTCAAGGVCWTEQAPNSGANAYYWADTASATFHYFDSNGSMGDGFLPDNDFIYTDSPFIRGGGVQTMVITGNLQDELAAGSDWNPGSSTLVLNDAGTNGDLTASDGVYSRLFTGLPISAYDFKVVDQLAADPWSRAVGTAGMGGDNIAFTQTAVDDVRVEVRAADGRYKITTSAPPPAAGTYAVSAGWSLSLDGTTHMTPAGSWWVGYYTVPVPGEYYVRVLVSDGTTVTETHPSIGDGYIIKTTTGSQSFEILFATLGSPDNAYPGDFIVADSVAARINFASGARGRVQFVGFLTKFGLSVDDWDTACTAAEGTETAPGTEMFRLVATATATASGVPVKAIADSDELAPLADVWDVQMGGDSPSGGLTYNGNNAAHTYSFTAGTTYAFWASAKTGRVKVAIAGSADDTQPEACFGSCSVPGWETFEN